MTFKKTMLRAVLSAVLLASGTALAAPADFIADLQVTVAADPIEYGDVMDYVFTIENLGPNHAEGVVVDSNLKAGAGNLIEALKAKGFVITGVSGCTPTTAAVAAHDYFPCTIDGIIADGASVDVVVSAELKVPTNWKTLACGATQTYANLTASVTSESTDPVASNDSATVTITDGTLVAADVKVTFTGPERVAAGTDVTYTVTVTNDGPCDSSTIWVLSDAYGSDFGGGANGVAPYVGMSPAETTTCLNTPAAGKDYETDGCNIGTLAVGASVSFTKTYSIPKMASDALSQYYPNGVTISGAIDTNAKTRRKPLAVPDFDVNSSDPLSGAPLDVASIRTETTQSAGCSTSGAGGPTGLLALGALGLLFRRRRS